jgi:multicomponent Na+:H+ antiporter subunit E
MFLALLVLWLVFASSMTVSNLVLGTLISGLITLFCHFFMGYSSKAFLASLKKLGAMLNYLGVLMLEIIKSNIAVIKLIWRKEAPQPNLVHFKTKLKSDAFKVLVANSITLTPGTYTVVLDGQDYAVHALDASFNEGMEENVFFQMTEKMEG